MQKALVTGASGFVGYWVARKLCERGLAVKVLLRSKPSAHLQALPVEIADGDLRNRESLKNALQGCDTLFHVAAHYSLWEKDPQVLYDSNVGGTRNILSLAAEQNISKIVATSSVATLRCFSDGKIANEQSYAELSEIIGHYKKSKYLAEKVALELAQEGAPIVIVNPSAPIGPNDVKPTPTGKIIVDFLQGKMPAYLDTGLNLVAVEDVAEGHVLAAEKGRVGERYILGNQNLRLIEILRILAEISGKKAPKIKMPYWIAYLAGYVSETIANLTNKPPAVPLDGVRMAKKIMFFDSTKAQQELGFSPTSVQSALERAVAWFQDNGYIHSKK